MIFCPLCGTELELSEIDGKERRSCSSLSCGYVFWDNPTPVVAAIIELDGNVVLARNKGWPEKMYGLITGFLEKGETPEDSILREIKEELGLEGKIADFVGYYSFFEMNQLIFVFHIEARGEVVLGEELAGIKIIDPDKLRPWSVGTGPAVSDWLESRETSRKR
jgi:NAD+ diphosphatase